MIKSNIVYNYLLNILDTRIQEIKYYGNYYKYFNIDLESAKPHLQEISKDNQKEIVNLLISFNENQLALFLENIKFDLKYSPDFKKLLQDTRDIKRGKFPKKIRFTTEYSRGCINTYIGFMRALKSGTLYTAKIKINGKLKRVFIKTPIGSTNNFNLVAGFYRVAIDPETMDVYSLQNKKNGKIDESGITKLYSVEHLEEDCNAENNIISEFAKNNYSKFRKELLERIDAIYGIERIVDTYLRMGGKINPQKYENDNFKEEMIRNLEEKFGTEKLLEWASKVKEPKDAAKLKLDILDNLSKYHGGDYKKHYKKEYNLAEKQAKAQKNLKTKPKTTPKRPI